MGGPPRARRAGRGGGARPRANPPPGGRVQPPNPGGLRRPAARARSRAELAQRLAAKGYTADVTDRALDRLAEVGLIDDAAFAEQWVHSRHTFSGKGKQALAQELRRKGVDPADAAPALDTITDDDEESRARDLVRRKLRTLPTTLDREKALRRLVGMLARRGYNQSTAFAVVKSELAEASFDTADLDERE
ncbi:recombination regulator RecX [Nocardia brasiliensis]|uniref:recombination regulator RecX n=1 Tax=Nocardia brasiliensis TaxID=37326 RepID=UPI0024553243|nr:recombination regulator RecX [Nocardia brasiliensis]